MKNHKSEELRLGGFSTQPTILPKVSLGSQVGRVRFFLRSKKRNPTFTCIIEKS